MDGGTKGSFWTSTAAILTGVGTLLAGLVALGTFAVSQHWFSGTDKVDDPVATGTNGQPLPKLDEVKQWGPDTLLFESGVDFDPASGPDRDVTFVGADSYYFDDKLNSPYRAVKWTQAKDPSQNNCATLIATHGTQSPLSIEVGDRFCVRTDKSRIVYFKVLSQASTGWELNVTVWKQRTSID